MVAYLMVMDDASFWKSRPLQSPLAGTALRSAVKNQAVANAYPLSFSSAHLIQAERV